VMEEDIIMAEKGVAEWAGPLRRQDVTISSRGS
jgi:hypothetical protein